MKMKLNLSLLIFLRGKIAQCLMGKSFMIDEPIEGILERQNFNIMEIGSAYINSSIAN